MRNPLLRICCVAAFIGFGIGLICWFASTPAQNFLQSENPIRQFFAVDSQPEIVRVRDETIEDRAEEPRVLVHVWAIELVITSPKMTPDWTEFNTSLQAAVDEFNSQLSEQSGDFVNSDTLAMLVEKFQSKGKVTIYNESPRLIASGQTDSWGDSIAISATPTINASDEISVALSAEYHDTVRGSGLSTRSKREFRSGQTLLLGGGASASTETKAVFPMLGRIPTIGPWLEIPVTRTKSWNQCFLASPRLVSKTRVPRQLE